MARNPAVTIDILKRMSRSSISLHIVDGGKLEVRAPYLVPLFIIEQFVASHADWIERNRVKAKSIIPKKIVYQEGKIFQLGGQLYELHITDGNAIALAGSRLLFPKKFLAKAKIHMEAWCRAYAKKFLKSRLDHYAPIMGVSYERISIRDTSTRWGSCSSRGTISFSYRLILAQLPIIDYVVIHELAHTLHHHHKASFWNFVGQFYPSYKEARLWLTRNGHTLRI
jgi:predicted metal-dependent hydrolase